MALCGGRLAEDFIARGDLIRPIEATLRSDRAFYILYPSGDPPQRDGTKIPRLASEGRRVSRSAASGLEDVQLEGVAVAHLVEPARSAPQFVQPGPLMNGNFERPLPPRYVARVQADASMPGLRAGWSSNIASSAIGRRLQPRRRCPDERVDHHAPVRAGVEECAGRALRPPTSAAVPFGCSSASKRP